MLIHFLFYGHGEIRPWPRLETHNKIPLFFGDVGSVEWFVCFMFGHFGFFHSKNDAGKHAQTSITRNFMCMYTSIHLDNFSHLVFCN